MALWDIEKRKAQHVDIVLNKKIDFRNKRTGFDDVDFLYQALPEMNFSEVDSSTVFLKRKLRAPLLVSSMTGGFAGAEKINRDIALACEKEGIMMGLGSQRPMLKDSKLAKTYKVKAHAPKVFLAGNIGAVQLTQYPVEKIEWLAEQVEADAFYVHINALQEVVQPEGDKNWKGVLKAIENLCSRLGIPVIAKEVGAGLNGEIAKELEWAGVKAIDVAGAGGTSWTAIELYRKGAKQGALFWDFGIPTVVALQQCSRAVGIPVIASGGVRNGLDVAKSIRLGASLAGAAQPFIKAQAKGGAKGVQEEIRDWTKALAIAMFLTRSKNVAQLRKAKLL
ncbi:MAG: type 2 isopentenyl-diphosphate Delta-isomerase [Candidatus Norongarragalinales archaeon]